MGKSSPPSPPDPAASAAAQATANKQAVRESAKVNQIKQVTPFGTVEYTGPIGSSRRTQTTTLSGAPATLANFANQYAPQVADSLMANPFSLNNLPPAPQADDAARQRIETGLMDRLDPYFQRDQAALDTRLANQGITQGSEAYRSGQDDLARARNDARLATIGAAGGELSRSFGLQSQERQSALNEALLQRSQPINELAALIQGSPAISSPNTQYQIAPADIMGAQALNYQGALNAYGTRAGQQNAALGGLAGLGASAITLSDRRLKTDIRRVGKTDGGIPVYTYRYKVGGPMQMGVMADEAPAETVHDVNGYQAVDYGMIE